MAPVPPPASAALCPFVNRTRRSYLPALHVLPSVIAGRLPSSISLGQARGLALYPQRTRPSLRALQARRRLLFPPRRASESVGQ